MVQSLFFSELGGDVDEFKFVAPRFDGFFPSDDSADEPLKAFGNVCQLVQIDWCDYVGIHVDLLKCNGGLL